MITINNESILSSPVRSIQISNYRLRVLDKKGFHSTLISQVSSMGIVEKKDKIFLRSAAFFFLITIFSYPLQENILVWVSIPQLPQIALILTAAMLIMYFVRTDNYLSIETAGGGILKSKLKGKSGYSKAKDLIEMVEKIKLETSNTNTSGM